MSRGLEAQPALRGLPRARFLSVPLRGPWSGQSSRWRVSVHEAHHLNDRGQHFSDCHDSDCIPLTMARLKPRPTQITGGIMCRAWLQPRQLSSSLDRDRRDDVAFEDSIDDVHAFDHSREDGVLIVEPDVVHQVHEDLAVTGVMAAR